MNDQDLNCQNEFFSAKQSGDIVMLTFEGKVLLPFSYLDTKEALLRYLDLVSETDAVKIVMITDTSERSPLSEYYEFYDLLAKSKIDLDSLHRMYHAYDQLILKVVGSNKFFISVAQGEVISQDFHVDLACDYRIVADNTVIHKPYLNLGLVPKGGGAYFLKRKMGHSRAYELLVCEEPLAAHEAQKLGIVNEVVPVGQLEDAAMSAARRFAQKPATSLSSLKKLLNSSLKDLCEYLELENRELLHIVNCPQVLKSYHGIPAEL
jgi:2-(1,2-epoxy-1,2-dihydrophenyl)acetyl-CoA isomerase